MLFLTPGSGINNPDHISESLETIFVGLKISLMRIRYPGWKKYGSGIPGMKKIRVWDPG
jgi:hypothetical protein